MTEYSSAELMIINAARLLRDGDTVFVGVGQPNLACNLAKRTHAPNLVMIYEAGVIGAEPARLPLSIGDPTLVSGSLSVVSMYDIFANYLQRGNVDVGFMGGAQIDKFGNINATVIGGYEHPKVRLPGSGGSQEIAAWANRCYIMTPHQKRRFPEKVEFMTSAGSIGGRGDREKAGLRGGGMLAVVTDIGMLEPDETGEMILTALHPDKTAEQAKENTGWDLKVASQLRTTELVTENELRILREELDPTGIYLKGGGELKRFWVGAFFLLWTGVIIITFYIVQKPNINALAGLADTLWTLLVAALLLFNAYGLGTQILNWFGLKSIDVVDRLLLSVGIGLGCLGLLGLGFSAAQLANATILTIFQIVLAILFILSDNAGKLHRDLKVLGTNLNLSFSQFGIFTKLAILLPLAFSFLLTLVPPFEAFDALLYHLAQPARILQDGGLRTIDVAPHFWFPNLTENVYLWALGMGSERASQILHFAWAFLAALLLWHWATKIWNIEIGRKTLLLLAAIASLPMLASWAYADMALAYYAVASLYALTFYSTTKTFAWLRIAAVAAGLAMAVKYTSFVVPLTCGLLLLFSHSLIIGISSTAQFSLIALATALPWYARNAILMGNPFYPFVFGGHYWDNFRAEWYAATGTGIGWNALQIFMLPLNTLLGLRDANFFDGRMGPLFLILAPFTSWILLSRTRRDAADGWSLLTIGVFSTLSFAAWTFGVINSAALWQSRLIFPTLMLFAIPTALGWDALKQFDTSKLRISSLINVLIAITLMLTIFDNGIFVLQRNPLAVAFGAQSRERYIERVNPSYAALMHIMDELPADVHIYSLFEPRSYDLPRPAQPDAIVSNFAHDQYLFHTSEEIIQHWKVEGYTHILVYERGLNFILENPPSQMNSEVEKTFHETIQGLKLISQTDDKVYTIYQIP